MEDQTPVKTTLPDSSAEPSLRELSPFLASLVPIKNPVVCPRCKKRYGVSERMARPGSEPYTIELECEHCKEIIRKECRISHWQSTCPPAFREFDESKLPTPSKFSETMKWEFGSKGLLLHGSTGQGKTFIAWQVVRRECINGRDFVYAGALSIGTKLAALFSESMIEAERKISQMAKTPLLFLDDPFKTKMTERIEETVYNVIAERTDYERPTIITLNDTAESLKDRISVDRAAPLLRRFRDYFSVVRF